MGEGSKDTAVRLVSAGGAIVSMAVLADSGLEHYRGSFHNPAMVLPLTASTLSLGFGGHRAVVPASAGQPMARAISHTSAAVVGLIGLGFHAFNIDKRPGGVTFTNLFYGAPIGAPAALVLASVLGAMADALASADQRVGPVSLASGRVVGAVAALGLIGTASEAALLHFRGAYHDPFMWAPVVLPPIAAASLARDVVADQPHQVTTLLLSATAALGLIGVGFHTYGVSRNMGGWRNWRQNILAGPPLPAPPAFTGLALAGLGALLLMRRRHG